MKNIESEINKVKVCAVVVTHNRKDLLLRCLKYLKSQSRLPDAIIIVDNASTDGTPELLLKEGYIKELPPKDIKNVWETKHIIKIKFKKIDIYYLRMKENEFSAGGFHEGIKKAYELKYDFIWLMDDDGFPEKDCLLKLLKYALKFNMNCVVGPIVIDVADNSKTAFHFPVSPNNETYDINQILSHFSNTSDKYFIGLCYYFNGILISRKIVKHIGYPKKELIIWGDEVDYFWRVKNAGFENVLILDAKHYHPSNRKAYEYVKIFKKTKKFISIKDPFRLYVVFRNTAYIHRKFYKYYGGIFTMLRTIIGHILYYLFYKKNIKMLLIFITAYLEGMLYIFRDINYLKRKYSNPKNKL